MKDLSIKRELNEDTRAQDITIIIGNEMQVFSLHVKGDEIILTDHSDYTKIYAIYSLEFFKKKNKGRI